MARMSSALRLFVSFVLFVVLLSELKEGVSCNFRAETANPLFPFFIREIRVIRGSIPSWFRPQAGLRDPRFKFSVLPAS